MNKLIGYKTDNKCPECKSKLHTNQNGDTWCKCGYASDPGLSKFITNMNRIVKYKSKPRINTLWLSIGLFIVSVSLLVFWMVVR